MVHIKNIILAEEWVNIDFWNHNERAKRFEKTKHNKNHSKITQQTNILKLGLMENTAQRPK
mgnify:CR=1 FL=1